MEIKWGKHIKKKDFRKIYDLYFNALCAFAYKYVRDIQEVEDLVQEVFVSLWEKREGFKEMPAIKSYLYTATRNKCLNFLKHKTIEQKHAQNLVQVLESEHEFNHQVIEEETFNLLFAEIRELPEASQQIMLLALNGLKNPEIAEELNVSVNTVKTHKKIAYAKLKSRLKPSVYAVLLSL